MAQSRKKIKFKPAITRIKLNPEQALLACAPKFRSVRAAPQLFT